VAVDASASTGTALGYRIDFGEVGVASPLGTWGHSGYFARLNRVEVRALAITAQKGNDVRGVLTKDGVSKTPFAGSIGADRRMRLVLEGSAESLEGLLPSMLSAGRAAWASSLRGGSLDGERLPFRRVIGEPSGTPPDSNLRMRFDVPWRTS
jgi:hypothetical protein